MHHPTDDLRIRQIRPLIPPAILQEEIPIIDEIVDYFAIAVANLAVSFDPQVIVLGGSFSPFADLLIEPILKRLEGTVPTLPNLVVSRLGLRAVIHPIPGRPTLASR